MKKLLLSIPFGMSVRNILKTDVFDNLKKKFDILIISNFSSEELNLDDSNLNLVRFPKQSKIKNKLMYFSKRIDYFYFWFKCKPDTMKKYIERAKRNSIFSYYIYTSLSKIWGFSKNNLLGRKIIYRIFYNNEYKKIIVDNKIDIVFVPSFDSIEDMILLNISKKLDIPISCFVHSWDNLPSRGSFIADPDVLIVWNNIMKKQAVELHNFDEDKIKVAGIPQYDTYRFNVKKYKKDEFKKIKNIEKYDKIITYTCSAKRVFSDEDVFISRLIDLIQSKTFGNSVLILRLHPTERVKQYTNRFNKEKDVIIDIPDGAFAAAVVNNIGESGIENFVNLMKHSDVVINLASTTSIDAAVFDTPVINIAYNNNLSHDAWDAAEKWYKSTHYKKIIETGGVKLAHSEEELIKFLKEYLHNSSMDRVGRLKIVKEQCHMIDGKASSRILEAITEVVD